MKKTIKITAITLSVILVILIFLVLTPFLFREKFAQIVKTTANKNLKTELNFSEMDVSFFHHFPNLTITLTDFSLKSSAPFTNDTLVSARDISFGVNLGSLFKGPLKINRVYLNKGRVFLKYNENGSSNFDVYNSGTDTVKKEEVPSGESVAIKIEHIIFIKTDFIYSDPSIPMQIVAHGINYHGQSDINKDILRLASKVRIDSLDFTYNHVTYLRSKPVKADLMTSIDMNTLNMKFEKNDMHIKDIPFEFKGEFTFRKDGYTFFLSLFSQFGEEYLSGSLWLVSSKHLFVSLKADVNMTLQNWAKGFDMKDMDLKGLFSLKVNAQGEYYSGQNPASSKPDTIPLSIPDFNLTSTLKNGFFHYKKLPGSVSNIFFSLDASSKNHDYKSISLRLENLKAEFMKNKIEGYFRLKGLEDLPVDAHLSTRINLAEIRQVIPLDSLDMKGMLDLNLDVNGQYSPAKKLFPVANVTLSVKDGELLTKYYPHPIEKINTFTTITNQTGKISDTRVRLNPFSFLFEGNPFEIKADVSNPDNIAYNIIAKGSIEIAKIYRVFSRKGLELDGYVSTDLNLQGVQSDATAGRYEKLHNSGKFVLRNIALNSEYLPKPLIVKSGIFRFDHEKLWFEKFDSRFGSSDIVMDGQLSNVLNYVLTDKQMLKGSFTFHSSNLVVDEFIMPVNASLGESNSSAKVNNQSPPGVVCVPDNVELGFKADVKKISYGKLEVKDFNAAVEIKKGLLLLKSMNFELVGCKVNMDATYGSINPRRAFFDFHVKAEDFDIKRAYNEVELFRNLSTSAGKCEGIVSLDYSLKGSLDAGMNPVYPSLEGSGVLSLKKVKVMGLKLFTAMSKNLDREKIKDPDLSKVEIKSKIKNNVISIEKTKMKISGFRFRIEGETNFNGSLNFKSRLGLPPLGIIGIPIRILGTQDNPKFKYGRGANDKDVEETEYSDEVPKEFLNKVKGAKEEELKDEPDPE
jgi:AsmA protein